MAPTAVRGMRGRFSDVTLLLCSFTGAGIAGPVELGVRSGPAGVGHRPLPGWERQQALLPYSSLLGKQQERL